MGAFESATELLRTCSPVKPVVMLRPNAVRSAALWFQEHFPGRVLFALKANNMPDVVTELYRSGIKSFDVASISEIRQISNYSDVEIYLMNPVNPRAVIAEAYYEHGVRNFCLDCPQELEKILEVTNRAKDLNLFVRIACESFGAQIALENKFGVSQRQAVDLLLAARSASVRLGITFHVGSQSMIPESFSQALDNVSTLITHAGVLPEMIDVGGGFPSIYPGMAPPSLKTYINAIHTAFERMNVFETCELMCEPGRALVAESGSLLVQVVQRKGSSLYINDGAYGALHDAAHYGFVYPTRLVRPAQAPFGVLKPFSFYGPTCDSADYMQGPFLLPECIEEGDYIEIGQLGAYGHVMGTRFNGFGDYDYALLEDQPMISMYGRDCYDCNQSDIALEQM